MNKAIFQVIDNKTDKDIGLETLLQLDGEIFPKPYTTKITEGSSVMTLRMELNPKENGSGEQEQYGITNIIMKRSTHMILKAPSILWKIFGRM